MEPFAAVVAAIARAIVGVQHDAQPGYQNATVALHNRFGQARGAARVNHPQWMIKRQPLGDKSRSGCIVACDCIGEAQRASHSRRRMRRFQHDQRMHVRQRGTQRGHYLAAIHRPACVADTVGGDQDARLDLTEAVDYRLQPHIGRAHAPHRANAAAGEKRHHGLRHVGQISHHAIATLHAVLTQGQCKRSHLALQFGPTQLSYPALLVLADDCRHACFMCSVHMPKHLVRIVHLCARKPARAGHTLLGQHRAIGRRRLHAAVLPDACPERVEIRD